MRAQVLHSMGDFFDKYASAQGVTSVRMERQMLRMMGDQAADRGDKELARLMKNIQTINIAVLKKGDAKEFIGDAGRAMAMNGGRYKLVTSSNADGQTTEFYLASPARNFSDDSAFVMLTYGRKETVVVYIYGYFDLQQIVRLSSLRPK